MTQWTGYLVREALIPRNQLSTDDFAGWLANQTNLALKGIIGIRAMADISTLVGRTQDALRYRDISSSYAEKWLGYAMLRDETRQTGLHLVRVLDHVVYNLFADSLLCFHQPDDSMPPGGMFQNSPASGIDGVWIPRQLYSIQSRWYGTVLQRYGLPLDNRNMYAKSDWQFFAATVAEQDSECHY